VLALVEVLVRVTERRRARSVWKFRPWSREMKMDRNAVEAIRRGVSTDIVSREVSVEGAHNQIPDTGRRRDSQVATWSMSRKLQSVQLWKALRSRKLMACLGQGGDLAICGRRGDPHPWSNYYRTTSNPVRSS
jgi:hypothetical protein